jgi:hypothetical protein
MLDNQPKNKLLNINNIKVIFEGTLTDCYNYENELRPSPYIGWNIATGGGGPLHGMTTDKLREYRSLIQSNRMLDSNLKSQQSKAFKENYYSNTSLQEIRKLRAIEHMSDPIKKSKCLNAIHTHIKCPYCEYVSNKGNISQHIKRNHN